jgi:hypothetical protein
MGAEALVFVALGGMLDGRGLGNGARVGSGPRAIVALLREQPGQPAPGAVQPHPDRGPAAAEHRGDLVAVQALQATRVISSRSPSSRRASAAMTALSGTGPSAMTRAPTAATSSRSLALSRSRRSWPRRWLASTRRATPYSHSRASSPAGTSSSLRQAIMNVSETTSAASSGLPARRSAYPSTCNDAWS